MRHAMLIVAVVVALAGLAGSGRVAAQDGGFATNPVGEPVTIYNVDGDPVAEVTAEEVIDPFEDYEEFGEPADDERFVLAAITVENTGDRPFEFSPYDFFLLDSLGRASPSTFVSRTDDSIDEYPDLESTNMNSGETVSGAVLYRVAADAELLQVYYSFYDDIPQLYFLADLSGGATGAGADDEDDRNTEDDDQDERTPDATDDEDERTPDATDDEEDADSAVEPTEENCAWAEDTLDRLSALQPVGTELQGMDDEDIDVERVREIADQLAEEAEAQRDSDPPAEAEEASDQIADALDTYADALYDVADAVEEDEVIDTTALLADVQDANELIEEAGTVTAPLLDACAD